jgi:hypothetical protein
VKTLQLTEHDRKQAELFADARSSTDTSLYEKRGSFKRDDILIGALAEIAVYKLLVAAEKNCTLPDFTIHKVARKSFSADLRAGSQYFHVKGQSMDSVKKYGSSWLMQKSDNLLHKDIGYKHYLAPCTVDLDTNKVIIYCLMNFNTIRKKGLIGQCKVPSFNRTKVAIYWDDLKGQSHMARWGVLKRGGVE